MFLRTILFSTLILICAGTVMAQRPGPEFWRTVSCQPLEPRTQLEKFENTHGILVKGFTRITTVDVHGIRIDGVEMRVVTNDHDFRAKGIVIALREGGERPDDNRAFVDYDEIDDLLNAIDLVSRVDETATKLTGFEARYISRGDLEISVFRQTRSGVAVTMSTGLCERTVVTLTLDDLAKVRAMIQEAKTRLDEVK
ncbi:MAG TPA: hypothetical protein VHS05_21330 [Pyrinomonadaceae bacterium]|jgi:hypothetical protein|nr:hypothetical protein [Pyrinomonadaceae bacterium]